MAVVPGLRNPHYSIRGGFQTASIYSGAVAPGLTCAGNATAIGSDVVFVSGPGRLNTVVLHANMTSGSTAIFFYDSSLPVSGGPIYASGHKVVAVIPSTLAVASGNTQEALPTPLVFDVPFQSGLCYNSRSGQPGITVCWTPEQPDQ